MTHTDILVIGAGPTGLGAAWQLDREGHRDWLLCEAASEAGGLAGSAVDAHGFTWDFGGHVQFSHYDYFDDLMEDLLGHDGWLHHDRESWVWLRDRFVPYPFQLNLRYLPEDDLAAAIRGLIHAACTPPPAAPAHFGEWIDATFGEGLARIFMRPYNTKVWAREPERMASGWVGERVAVVNLPRVVENIARDRDDVAWGPNNRFQFPRHGGTGAVWSALARRVAERHPERLQWRRRLCALDTANRIASFADGGRVHYERLVTTMAVDELIAMSDVAPQLGPHARRLEYSTTHVIGVGLHGQPPPALETKCWMYFPEPNAPFYRVTHFSRYSPHNVADPGRQWSLMAEVAESPYRPLRNADVVSDTVAGMVATQLIPGPEAVHHTWHRALHRGYPVPSIARDAALAEILPALEARHVYSRGRFGAWKYEVSNQDHSFAQGVEVVQRLLHGLAEETLNDPNFVNSRPKRALTGRTAS
jgi:protoporphyrinogen oxidase